MIKVLRKLVKYLHLVKSANVCPVPQVVSGVGLYPGLGMQYEMCFADLKGTVNM